MAKTIKLVRFYAACNHVDNGMFVGRFDAARFEFTDKSEISFDCMPTRIRSNDGVLTVGRVKVAYKGYGEWIGNWCWNGWSLLPKDAVPVMQYLIEKRQAAVDMVDEGDAQKHWNAFCVADERVIF